jgi:hypothetical protein
MPLIADCQLKEQQCCSFTDQVDDLVWLQYDHLI